MLKNTSETYGSLARIFHWTMGIIIICLISVGFTMTSLADTNTKWFLYTQHKAFGVIILTLIPLRILWRLINPKPKLPKTLPRWQKTIANLNTLFLYICMLIMPFSGFMMSAFGGYPISFFNFFIIPAFEKHQIAGLMNQVHGLIAYGIAFSVILHILAALYHHFIIKDKILRRILMGN